MEERVEALERNMERREQVNAGLREQVALTGHRMDQLRSQLERTEQMVAAVAGQESPQPSSTEDGEGGGRRIEGLEGSRSFTSARKDPQLNSFVAGDGGSDGGDGIGGNQSFISARKVECPSFGGEDPFSWLTKAEQNFSIQNTADSMKNHCTRKLRGSLMRWELGVGEQQGRTSFWTERSAQS